MLSLRLRTLDSALTTVSVVSVSSLRLPLLDALSRARELRAAATVRGLLGVYGTRAESDELVLQRGYSLLTSLPDLALLGCAVGSEPP